MNDSEFSAASVLLPPKMVWLKVSAFQSRGNILSVIVRGLSCAMGMHDNPWGRSLRNDSLPFSSIERHDKGIAS
jgi:hypothetical protein